MLSHTRSTCSGTGGSMKKQSSADGRTGPLASYAEGFAEELTQAGYSEHTVYQHSLLVAHLSRWMEGRRLEPAGLTADLVDDFLRERRGAGYRAFRTARGLVPLLCRLRSLLRFLHLSGRAGSLADAVPTIARWRLDSLPRGLESGQATLLLDSCDLASPVGRRDRAMLSLLVRLGLRAGEVAALEIDDFDWHRGEVVIRGKGDRRERLPLPVDVGEAVAVYIMDGRPSLESRRLFMRVRAPMGDASKSSVQRAVRQACDRVGIPWCGTHRLRHTAATEMLRSGASLPEVGQVLRHQSIATTAIYAKVDRVGLRTLARPWPGGAA